MDFKWTDVLQASKQTSKENDSKEKQRSEVWKGFMFPEKFTISYHQTSFKKD